MNNWTEKRLGEVCTLQRGFDLPTKERKTGNYPLISSSGFIDSLAEAKVSGPGVVTGRSGSIGSVFFIDRDFWPLNTTLYVKDFHGNDPRFIFYLLRKFDLKRFASGSGVPTLNRNSVHSELVYVSSNVSEQKRIVAILDEAFEGIDRAIANTEKNLANTRELFESYLNAIFTQKGDQWVDAVIEDHIKFIDYRGRTPNKTQEGMRLITAKNVKMGFLQTEPQEFVAPDIYDDWMTRGIPQKGDVLFTTEAPLGNVAQLDTYEKVVFAQRIIIMQPDTKFINKTFLKFLLFSDLIQQRIHDKATGATAQGIKASLLKKIQISFPCDLLVQKKIVLKLETLEADTKRLETIYRQKLAALNELKQSILQKAFTGELTADTSKTIKEKIAA
jgi:type I restriction enzyme S subunit